MVEEKSKQEALAKFKIFRGLDQQKSNIKMRLAQRKKQLELKKSGFLDLEDNFSLMRRQPMSTRAMGAQSFTSKLRGGLTNALLNDLSADSVDSDQQSMEDRRPDSTRARNDRMLSGDNAFGNDTLNDISGIVQDESNIDDTSFAITIDTLNAKTTGNKRSRKST